MAIIKIMPCLGIKGEKVTKCTDAGDPLEMAVRYQEEGADELALIDIAARSEQRKIRPGLVKKISSSLNIPLTIGGGISTLDDICQLLDIGATKVILNTAAVDNPQLIEDAARLFYAQKLLVAIDARTNARMPSGYEVMVQGTAQQTGIDVVEWACKCAELGAGTILATAIDQDGTRNGYDLKLTKAISESVILPVAASGGAGSLEHFCQGAAKGGAGILLASSVFHSGELGIGEVKGYLQSKGLRVNL